MLTIDKRYSTIQEMMKGMVIIMLNIGFIGFGLIGGSIARILKIKNPDCIITAFSRSTEPLQQAKLDGNIDIITSKIDSTFSNCNYIFLCTPVQYNAEYLKKLKPFINKNCIITDVGSVKENIHKSVIELGMEENFIGGHPMAGSEKTGYANSSAYLLENAFYAITPTSLTRDENLNQYVELVKQFGSIPVIVDYKQHDYSVAGISHLPHIIAGSLVNLVKDSDNEEALMKMLAAGGFKDITRIASSSPEMWEQICMTNSHAIVSLLNDYITSLSEIKSNIEQQNSNFIYQLFEKSREYRNSFEDISHGFVKAVYKVNCDIIDTEGSIAKVATLLANNHISIRNISIVNNREFEHGTLRIEFYDLLACNKAKELLNSNGYTVHVNE